MNRPKSSVIWFFFSFEGRINRAKFWLYWALYIVSGLIVDRIWLLLEGPGGASDAPVSGPADIVMILVTLVYLVVALWTYLAVHVKRWHDRNKSGWWVLIELIPIIGFLWAMIECGFLKGTEGDNRFGSDPLGPEWASVFD